MDVIPVPCLGDNYAYLLVDRANGIAAAVDPVEPKKVLRVSAEHGVKITMILTTHKHWDHAGGNQELKAELDDIVVVGGRNDDVKACTRAVVDGEELQLGNIVIKAIWTPCHTRGHTCYYATLPASEEVGHVFTGDTLFVAGCGRFFEGDAAEMNIALNTKLASLPDSTRVWCGHEYTVKNLQFAQSVEPDNAQVAEKLLKAKEARAQGYPTVPSTLIDEKATNPFMRVAHLSQIAGDEIETMRNLRAMKDKF
mmetsp:Transcript_5676/g.15168  ORF Transcript_5676/g.15168 Transcript_5676/m.15168 type:complete len:253 (-) Transcript_5676:347-1105(-)